MSIFHFKSHVTRLWQFAVITLKTVAMVWRVVLDLLYGDILTASSEMESEPGSLQIRTRGEGIGPLICISFRVLKVSLESKFFIRIID